MIPRSDKPPSPVLEYARPERPRHDHLLLRAEPIPGGLRLVLRPPLRWQVDQSRLPGTERFRSGRSSGLYKVVLVVSLIAILGLLLTTEGASACAAWLIVAQAIVLVVTWKHGTEQSEVGESAVLEATPAGLLLRLDGISASWWWNREELLDVGVYFPPWRSAGQNAQLMVNLAGGRQVALPVLGELATCHTIAGLVNQALHPRGDSVAR